MSEAAPAPSGEAFSDEQVLDIPGTWRRRLHPRRGGLPVPAVEIDTAAPGEIAAYAREDTPRAALRASLTSADSEPELVEAARSFEAGDITPLGAALVANVRLGGVGTGCERLFERHVDSWIVEHGPVFAARAYTEYSRLAGVNTYRGIQYRHLDAKAMRFLAPDEDSYRFWQTGSVGRKIRALLAAADNDLYEDAVKGLADHRTTPYRQAVVSYLVPTRQDWVDECCQTFAPASPVYSRWLVWTSLGSPEQLELLQGQMQLSNGDVFTDVLATLLEAVGAAMTPLLLEALDRDHNDARTRRLLLETLAMLPDDEAFQGLLDRFDGQYVQAAVAAAAKRFPARALRLLAPACAGTSRAARFAAETLRTHLPVHPDIAAQVLPTLPEQARAAVEPSRAAIERHPEAPAEALPSVLTAPPWTGRRKTAEPALIAGLEPPARQSLVWAPDEWKTWAAEYTSLSHLAENGGPDQRAGEFSSLNQQQQIWILMEASADVAVELLQSWEPEYLWYPSSQIRPLVAHFGLDALPLSLRLAVPNRRPGAAACSRSSARRSRRSRPAG